MRVTTEILKQLGNITIADNEFENLIKEHIANVEYVHNTAEDYKGILVGEIVEKENHPNADKLGVYKVFVGEKRIQVVAGDKSLEIGDKVAYIPPGSIVPFSFYANEEPIVIEAVELRGIKSNGMLGSEKELNLGTNHSNVYKLPYDAIPGTLFSEYFEFEDTVIEIENKGLTNRGDLFGIMGIARELTAITGNKFESPAWILKPKTDLQPEENCLNLEIVNDAEALCPRYMGIALDNISIKPSPIWLQSALLKLDIKPINNVIDITNYVSAILGQPLHAFDYDKIISEDKAPDNKVKINIRMGREGESILGLDNKVHNLNDRTIVIADNNHPIAIAGVIGGLDSSVDYNTKRIIIESANFDKNSVRKTSMSLGISTDAATKFKHSLDPEGCLPALLKTVELVKELAEGKIASKIIDIFGDRSLEKKITIDIDRLNSHIGTSLNKELISTILKNLEYKINSSNKNFLTVTVPTWRKDIQLSEDIHEDVARIFGYNNIEIVLPKKQIKPLVNNTLFELKKELRKTFSTLGLNEILTYSFTSIDNFEKTNLVSDYAYRLKNPLSPELSLMRISLLQSILPKMKENKERGFNKFGLFEINIPHIKKYTDENSLPKEDWHFSAVLLDTKKVVESSSYYLAKEYTEKLFELRNVKTEYLLVADSLEQELDEDIKAILNIFDPNVSAFCIVEKKIIGVLGEIKQNIKSNFKLPEFTCAIDINLSKLIGIKPETLMMKTIPVFPSFSLDLCFETSISIKYSEMEKLLKDTLNSKERWANVECRDIFQGKKEEEKKRTTFRIIGGNYTKTLNDKDIKKLVDIVSKKMEEKFEAKVI